MLKTSLKISLTLMLLSNIAYGQEVGPFNTQDVDYTYPDNMNNYIATRGPIPPLLNHYFGINMGGDYASLKFHDQFTVAGFAPASVDISKKSFNYHAGLCAGYGTNFDNVYVAGELTADYSSLYKNATDSSTTFPFNPATISIRTPVVLGLDLIPGYLTDSRAMLLYGRLGVGATIAQLKLTYGDSGDPLRSLYQSNYKYALGTRIGAGIEFFLNEAFSIRTEYTLTQFAKMSDSISSYATLPLNYSYYVKPNSINQANLALVIHF